MRKTFDKKFGEDFLASVPNEPGVYRFVNRNGNLVYVGKAKDLRARLGQYRNASRKKAHRKMRRIVKASVSIELEVTETEAEALLLENELIQEHRPSKNVEGAYSFLYPTIGVKRTEHHLHVAYSTNPDGLLKHEFRRFGCYRNRRVSRAGFDALMEILSWLGHVEGAEEHLKYTFWRRFRQIPDDLDEPLARFLTGESGDFLTQVFKHLVEKPVARREASEVQTALRRMKRFFDREAKRLGQLMETSGLDYIPQDERDRAYIKAEYGDEADI